MTSKIALILFLFATGTLAAQPDSLHHDKGRLDYSKPRKQPAVKTRYGIVDLGFSLLTSDVTHRLPNGIDPFELRTLNSTNINFHIVQQRLSLARRYINLIYGITFEAHRYSFENPVVLVPRISDVTFDYREDKNFKKNRLAYSYLTIPLMINLRSAPRHPYRSFYLSAGGFAGVRLGSNFKTKERGSKDKVRDNYGLNMFRYGLRAEVGYGPVILYGTWTLNGLFDPDKNGGYDVTPFAAGFVIWPF